MKNGVSKKLMPFCLGLFAITTMTERKYQAIEIADHTQLSTLDQYRFHSGAHSNPRLLYVSHES
jgi:hypothetical protein